MLPIERRFVRDGVRECIVIGIAGEPILELDRDMGVALAAVRGKRNGVPISSSTEVRGEP